MISRRSLVIFSIIAALFIGISIFAVYRSVTKTNTDSTTQTTAPPYDGIPAVAFKDETNGKLYNAIGGDNYINIKYFLGDYVVNNGGTMSPLPVVTVSNFTNDTIPQAEIGVYTNVYTFDAYIQSINQNLSIRIEETTGNPTTITIIGTDYTRYLESYVNDTH